MRESELTSRFRCLGSGYPDCEFELDTGDRSSGGLERLYTAAGRVFVLQNTRSYAGVFLGDGMLKDGTLREN